MEEEEEAAAAKVTFSGVRLKKRKEATTPEGTPDRTNLIAGTELIGKRRTLDASRLRKKTSMSAWCMPFCGSCMAT